MSAQVDRFRDAFLYPDCRFQGVAGQVLLTGSVPGTGFIVQVTGTGISGTLTAVSGTNTNYGASGWEVKVANAPVSGTYQVQLLSPDGTVQLSPAVEISFPNSCQANLAVINFVQVRPF
jgi:hypothetical protein